MTWQCHRHHVTITVYIPWTHCSSLPSGHAPHPGLCFNPAAVTLVQLLRLLSDPHCSPVTDLLLPSHHGCTLHAPRVNPFRHNCCQLHTQLWLLRVAVLQVEVVGVDGELKRVAQEALTTRPNFAYTLKVSQ